MRFRFLRYRLKAKDSAACNKESISSEDDAQRLGLTARGGGCDVNRPDTRW